MLPWILLAISVAFNAVVAWHARSEIVQAKEAIEESAAIKKVYSMALHKMERKFGEKRVGRVARDVLREVTNEAMAQRNGVV